MSVKVIHFVSGLGNGGQGILVKEWLRNKSEDITMDVATVSSGLTEEELKTEKCTVYHIAPVRECGMRAYLRNAEAIFRQDHYDVVHSHVGVLSWLIFLAAKKSKTKVCFLHAHGTKYNTDGGSLK